MTIIEIGLLFWATLYSPIMIIYIYLPSLVLAFACRTAYECILFSERV